MYSHNKNFNNIILSEKITTNAEVNIPQTDLKYSIHFYVHNGEPLIYFNNIENEPSLKLYPGCKWNVRTYLGEISKIFIQSENEFCVWVIVEKT